MTPEEVALQIVNDCATAGPPEPGSTHWHQQQKCIAGHIRAAVQAERERACKAMCFICQRGEIEPELVNGLWRHKGLPCYAHAIRALPENEKGE